MFITLSLSSLSTSSSSLMRKKQNLRDARCSLASCCVLSDGQLLSYFGTLGASLGSVLPLLWGEERISPGMNSLQILMKELGQNFLVGGRWGRIVLVPGFQGQPLFSGHVHAGPSFHRLLRKDGAFTPSDLSVCALLGGFGWTIQPDFRS